MSIRFFVSCGLFFGALSGCQSESSSALKATHVANASELEQTFQINNQEMKHNDEVSVPLDPNRKIDLITVYYSGNYKVPALDSQGNQIKADEVGKYIMKDGFHAQGYVVSASGEKTKIYRETFIDQNEKDNWHDLGDVQGQKLIVKVYVGANFVNDPEVIAKGAKSVSLSWIKVRYKDNDKNFVEFKRCEVSQGINCAYVDDYTVSVPKKGKKIYRVNVYWGDEKPRKLNPVTNQMEYDPGTADGVVQINGKNLGASRNVSAEEDQLWLVDSAYPESGENDTVKIQFSGDQGRVFYIRVYQK